MTTNIDCAVYKMAFSLSQIMYHKCRSVPLLLLFRMIVFFHSPSIFFPFYICLCLILSVSLHDQCSWRIIAEVFVRGFRGHRLLFCLPTKHLFPCAHLLRERERGREEVKMERSRKSQRWRWLVRFCIAYTSVPYKS